MLIPNQLVEVKMSGKTIPHYRELGYEIKSIKDKIIIPVEHLTSGSHVKVDIICDCCGNKFQREYKTYLSSTENGFDYCEKCGKGIRAQNTVKGKYGVNNVMDIPGAKEKMKKTCLERYGAEFYSQTEEFKKKVEQTCLEKYGVKTFLSSPKVREQINHTVKQKYGVNNIGEAQFVREKIKATNLEKYGFEVASQSSEIYNKIRKTCFEKYGTEFPSQLDEFKNKTKETCLNRYGIENPSKLEVFKEKSRQTCLNKYGVESYSKTDEYKERVKNTCIDKYGVQYPTQSQIVKEKIINSFSKNNSISVSKQQIELYNLIQKKYNTAEINYPFSKCCLDIFISVNDIKIDIEYDGWYWHQDKQKDIKRDKFLQRNGIKILRIRSGHKLPTEEQLFQAINELLTTDRQFKEIILNDWKTIETENGGEKSA